MKRAFTLIEMLIVVAILAVLMSVMFRIAGIGDQDNRRVTTVVRLQKIENCLSGYYAAFGSYPPVKQHGSPDINMAVDENGDQDPNKGGDSKLNWLQVNAACRCQPFGCEYPGDQYENEEIEAWAEALQERANNSQEYPAYANSPYASIYQQGFTGPNPNAGGFRSEWDNADWKAIKLFKFGMMSFLLPRYLFMMGGDSQFFGRRGAAGSGSSCAQWESNNDMPSDPFEGRAFDNWEEVKEYAQTDVQGKVNRNDLARVANIPSQAVCARWMPNLEGICSAVGGKTFFGVTITGSSALPTLSDDYAPDPGTHYPPSGRTPYKNASVTVHDGWVNEFYYHSAPPYQSYMVWSAGANGKTFPPWMPVDELSNVSDRKTAIQWKSDDIMQMSH